MATTDDAIFGGGGGSRDMPVITAQRSQTAQPAIQGGMSETEKRNRRMAAASLLTRNWNQTGTAKAGLMGL